MTLARWAKGHVWDRMAADIERLLRVVRERPDRLTARQQARLRNAYLAVHGAAVKSTDAAQRLPFVHLARRHQAKIALGSPRRRPTLVTAMVLDMALVAAEGGSTAAPSASTLERVARELDDADIAYLSSGRRGPYTLAAYVMLRARRRGKPTTASVQHEVRALREAERRAREPGRRSRN